jgi:hypothetical protein
LEANSKISEFKIFGHISESGERGRNMTKISEKVKQMKENAITLKFGRQKTSFQIV